MYRAAVITSFALSFSLVACGPSGGGGGGGGGGGADARVTDEPCSAGETRCSAGGFQICQDGVYVEDEACSDVCDPTLGCVECRPDWGRVCSGDSVYECTEDGTVGELIETCELEQCNNGSCDADDDCAEGAELIYVVDQDDRLWSFDPSQLPGDPFTEIGTLNCPQRQPWLEWGGDYAPFSMSVDRDARAWVLYTSGDIFSVSTDDASCEATTFEKGQSGFKLFGMGFVSDSPGSSEETLFISGGPVNANDTGNLGTIDPETLQVTDVGPLPSGAEYSPELTGTGDAELFGYYPGSQSTMVANIVKDSAMHGDTWPMDGLGDQVSAWAFAQWGGKFYIFITTGGLLGSPFNSQVHLLDPETGDSEVILDDTGKVVVGAGVSTCAPVVID